MERARKAGHPQPAEICTIKLFAPPEFKGAIRRDTILDRIFVEHGPRVILFQGPAGHGKSTLLQQAKSTSETQHSLTGWMTFDEADNDLRRFYLHLQALIASVHPVKSLPALPDTEEGGAIGLWRPVEWFINRLIETEKPVSLFFDEFQKLTDKAILAFFHEILERVPENARIFIGSRSVPEIGLARLVVNSQALVVRTDELRFSLAEVTRFFATVPDLNIRSDEVEAIYSQSEGWPAALQLFRLTMVSPSVRRSLGNLDTFRPPQIAEYLADNVLVLQTPEIQDFLRKTSLLTGLCAPLCDAVMGSAGSQKVLLFLEHSGLFVRSLDSERRWFSYHSLFSSFLQEQLRQVSEEAVIEVHGRATRWYRQHGLFEEAMHHAIAAREHVQASDIMDTWSSRLIGEAHLMTVERWYERLPLDEIEKRQDLAVKIAWALTFLRRHAKLAPILHMLERQQQTGAQAATSNPQIVRAMAAAILVDDLPRSFDTIRMVDVNCPDADGFHAFELGAAANLKAYHALTVGDFDSARELLSIARTHSERAEAAFSLGYALANTGFALIMQGRLHEALGCFRAGVSDPRIHLNESCSGASLVSCYTQALYEANEIDAAELQFNEFREVIAQTASVDYLAISYVAMARINDLCGRPQQASDLLDEAERIGFANSLPRLVRTVNWERIRRLLLQGEHDRAASLASRICEPALPEGWIPFAEDTEGDSIGRARLAIHTGSPDQGLRDIAGELAIAQRTGRVRRQIKLHVLEAVGYAKKGADSAAHDCLRSALELAQRGGFIRTILDEGDQVVQLLRQEYEALCARTSMDQLQAASLDFIKKLLNVSGTELQKAQARNRFEPLEPLTRKEVDLLVFLANGLSNKEMARRIFVSENTVKFHLKNIYSKLTVTSRLQAINAARQMGLI